MKKYDWVLNRDYPDLIQFFKDWHLRGKTGNGDLFARIISKLQSQTGMSNNQLAKEIGVSKGLISQSRTYLRLSSPELQKWVQDNSVAINTAYKLTRLENYEDYERVPSQEYLIKNVPPWIKPIRDYYLARYEEWRLKWLRKYHPDHPDLAE